MNQPVHPDTRRLDLQVASGDRFDVRTFTVEERMNELFAIRLVAVSENPAPALDAIVGQPAQFALVEPHHRTWPGICRSLVQLTPEPSGLSTYEIHLVPRLWLTTQRRNHRMFQQVSDPDIVLQLLGEWGIEPRVAFSREAHPTRKYRVQYGESDYVFMSRLLEDAGLSFFFDDGAQLVIADAPEQRSPRAPIPFSPDAPFFQSETITELTLERRVRPGAYTMVDHDYRRAADYDLRARAQVPASPEQQLERYHYVPGAFLFGDPSLATGAPSDDRGATRHSEAQGEQIARRRLDAQRGSAFVVRFDTTAFDLGPGTVFGVLDHPHDVLAPNRPLLVLASTLEGGTTSDWTLRCEATGTQQPYRPPLKTPKPETRGVESATVVGPAGEEIHCDEFGRVRVHFHWDRHSNMDEQSSCWIHVSQPWAGTGFGGTNLPRIGQEVLVDFLGGDPDRPVITGRVYTNVNQPPYPLPQNKTQSGWRSMSSPGGGGYNELMFEDAKGKERVNVQAERNMDTLVKNDQTLTVGRHREETIGVTQRTTIGQALVTTVGAVSAEQVGFIKRVDVGQLAEITVGRSKLVMKANGDITLSGRSILIEGEQVKVIGDPIELN